MDKSYLDKANEVIAIGKKLNLERAEITMTIICHAEDYDDEEVRQTFVSLPEEIKNEIEGKFSSFRQTGKYYIVSSNGMADVTPLMERLSKLV